MGVLRAEVNGIAADPEVWRTAQWFGHFTFMQVRGPGRAVVGWRRHLSRLSGASWELFGRAPGPELVTERVLGALRGMPEAVSLRINAFWRGGVPEEPVEPDLLITVSDPEPAEALPPLRVRIAEYERDLPHLKHVDFLGVLHRRRLARAAGFDDVLFRDRRGRISEGSLWNVAFWDGRRVVWPDAAHLPGITMQVLAEGLDRIGVPQATEPVGSGDLRGMRAAFAVNSIRPAQPIGVLDNVRLPGGTGVLDRAAAAVPAKEIS